MISWACPQDEPGALTATLHLVDPDTGKTAELGPVGLDARSPAWWHDGGCWHVAYLAVTPPGLVGFLGNWWAPGQWLAAAGYAVFLPSGRAAARATATASSRSRGWPRAVGSDGWTPKTCPRGTDLLIANGVPAGPDRARRSAAREPGGGSPAGGDRRGDGTARAARDRRRDGAGRRGRPGRGRHRRQPVLGIHRPSSHPDSARPMAAHRRRPQSPDRRGCAWLPARQAAHRGNPATPGWPGRRVTATPGGPCWSAFQHPRGGTTVPTSTLKPQTEGVGPGAASMRLGQQVKRSCRDALAARSDPGHGPA